MECLACCYTRERAALRHPSVRGSVYSFHQEQPVQGNTFASSILPLLQSSDHKSQQSTPAPARQYFCEPPAQARKSYHISECIQPDSGEELEEQKAACGSLARRTEQPRGRQRLRQHYIFFQEHAYLQHYQWSWSSAAPIISPHTNQAAFWPL